MAKNKSFKGFELKKQDANINVGIIKLAAIAVIVMMVVMLIAIAFDRFTNKAVTELPPELPSIYPFEANTDNTQRVKLFFRFENERFLACQTRSVVVDKGERIESAVIRELILGPTSANPELEGLLPPQTKVVKIDEAKDTLFVTLNNNFIYKAPSNDAGQTEIAQAALKQRLAVQSIVNTITGMGVYANVLLLIDYDNSNTGMRPTWQQLGFTDAAKPLSPAEPIAYADTGVLTPENTVELVLSAIVSKDYLRCDPFILAQASASSEILSIMEQDPSLARIDGFEVLGGNLGTDNKSYIVRANIMYSMTNGSIIKRRSVPLKLASENEIWKLEKEMIAHIFKYKGG